MPSSQIEILTRFATPSVWEMVQGRLFQGVTFFNKRALKPEFKRGEVKLCLLLVRQANPDEPLSSEEMELIGSKIKTTSKA